MPQHRPRRAFRQPAAACMHRATGGCVAGLKLPGLLPGGALSSVAVRWLLAAGSRRAAPGGGGGGCAAWLTGCRRCAAGCCAPRVCPLALPAGGKGRADRAAYINIMAVMPGLRHTPRTAPRFRWHNWALCLIAPLDVQRRSLRSAKARPVRGGGAAPPGDWALPRFGPRLAASLRAVPSFVLAPGAGFSPALTVWAVRSAPRLYAAACGLAPDIPAW